MTSSYVILKLNSRVESAFFMSGGLTSPQKSVLPLEMTNPFIGGGEEDIPLAALGEETHIRLNVSENMPASWTDQSRRRTLDGMLDLRPSRLLGLFHADQPHTVGTGDFAEPVIENSWGRGNVQPEPPTDRCVGDLGQGG